MIPYTPKLALKRLSFSPKNECLTPFGCREHIFVSGGECAVRTLSQLRLTVMIKVTAMVTATATATTAAMDTDTAPPTASAIGTANGTAAAGTAARG